MMKKVTNNFGDGINTGLPPFDIKDNELTYIRDLSSQDYPSLSVRPGRTFLSTSMPTLTTPNAIGERNNSQLHVIDGNTWKRWDTATTAFVNLTTALSNTDAEFLDFVTSTSRYTIMMNSTQMKYWDGTSTVLNLGDANTPFTKIFVVQKDRLYAANDATIYYSAKNNINDWTTANDAGKIPIARCKGSITGLCEFNDKVIVFTESSMHELFGTGPSNYDLIDVEGEIGCLSNRSIIKANKKLYWYWTNGIYEYNGGSPIKISQPVEDYINGIAYANRTLVVSGSRADIVYFAIPYNSSTNNILLVYDTRIGKWYVETGNFKDFVTIQNTIYGMDSTGGILNMRNTSTDTDNGVAISYDFITKPYVQGSGNMKQTLWDESLLYNGNAGATLNVSYSTASTDNNSTSFNAIAASSDFTFDGKDHVKRIIPPSNAVQDESFYRLRFSGTGAVTFHRLEQNYRVKRR
jgi:hypothetical protein